jgi:uncharacterized protein YqjF (DUF2071 family)
VIRRAIGALATISESLLAIAPGVPAELSQARVIDQTENRPWRVPHRPWLMAQTWRDLLFAHWALSPEKLRPLLPGSLPLDTFDGRAWVGITPFAVSGLRPRGAPPPPIVSSFLELNVRTYTTLDGRPGIYFLSLDAAAAVAVFGARRAFRLPYFRARMQIERRSDGLRYQSERALRDNAAAEFEAAYGPNGPAYRAASGSLDYFLTERYCLYTVDEQEMPLRAEIQHPPWLLQPARATIVRNSMTRPWGLELPEEEPLLHFSRLQNVLIWSLEPATAH